MALIPKRSKYRKEQRGRVKGKATRGNTVAFGDYGIKALQHGWLNSRQIEAGRVAATHFLRHEGKVYIRVFPHKPVTSVPQETRMGKGKGEPEHYVAVVKPGAMLFEIGGVPRNVAKAALNRIAHKLSVSVRFVEKSQLE